jgi:hypothetical protein
MDISGMVAYHSVEARPDRLKMNNLHPDKAAA